jgi:hypothetical protein
MYLIADNTSYQMFDLRNKEFAFDVDISNLPCGFNGALFFVGMDSDGGLSKHSHDKAGAKYRTGYCDAQCSRVTFINGEAHFLSHSISLCPISSYLFSIRRLRPKAHTAHAAARWTSGRQTPMGQYTLPMYAVSITRLVARAVNAVVPEYAMRRAAGSIHTSWVTPLSTVWEQQLTCTINLPS